VTARLSDRCPHVRTSTRTNVCQGFPARKCYRHVPELTVGDPSNGQLLTHIPRILCLRPPRRTRDGTQQEPGYRQGIRFGLLGTGVVSQLLVLWGTTGDIESAMWGLLGFSVGGVIGLAIGLLARGGNGLQAKGRA
jgi:hypothetical protein